MIQLRKYLSDEEVAEIKQKYDVWLAGISFEKPLVITEDEMEWIGRRKIKPRRIRHLFFRILRRWHK